MSLINDALKKAQNLQTRPPGAPPSFPQVNAPLPVAAAVTPGAPSTVAAVAVPPPVAPPAAALPPRKGKSPHSAVIIGIACTVLLAGLGAIGYVVYALFFMGSPEEQAVADAPVIVQPATSPGDTPPSAANESSADVAVVPATTASATPVPPVVPTGAAPVLEPAPTSATSAPAAASQLPPPAETLAAAPAAVPEEVEERINNPKPHIHAWVDKIAVSGIRPGDRPKLLMNDRVYLVGDMVNRELGLHLASIGDRVLVFEDAEGNTYDYTF